MGQQKTKAVKGKFITKHETEEIWDRSNDSAGVAYVPAAGEQVIYDPDDNYSYPRTKYGDGVNKVKDLPFASDPFAVSFGREQNLTDEEKEIAKNNLGLSGINTDTKKIKEIAEGNPVRIDDISPLEHEIKVKLSGGEVLTELKNIGFEGSDEEVAEIQSGDYVVSSVEFDDISGEFIIYLEGINPYLRHTTDEINIKKGDIVRYEHIQAVAVYFYLVKEDYSSVTLTKYGKNLLDLDSYSAKSTKGAITNEPSYGTTLSTIKPVPVLEITQTKYPENSDLTSYKNGYCHVFLKHIPSYGENYTFSCDIEVLSNPLATNKIQFRFNDVGVSSGTFSNGTAFEVGKKYSVYGYMPFQNNGKQYVEIRNAGMSLIVSNMQLEIGATATEYVSFKEPITCTTDENGNATILSLAPTTTIIASDGATINAEYDKNINKILGLEPTDKEHSLVMFKNIPEAASAIIDTALSASSTNAIQNATITNALSKKANLEIANKTEIYVKDDSFYGPGFRSYIDDELEQFLKRLQIDISVFPPDGLYLYSIYVGYLGKNDEHQGVDVYGIVLIKNIVAEDDIPEAYLLPCDQQDDETLWQNYGPILISGEFVGKVTLLDVKDKVSIEDFNKQMTAKADLVDGKVPVEQIPAQTVLLEGLPVGEGRNFEGQLTNSKTPEWRRILNVIRGTSGTVNITLYNKTQDGDRGRGAEFLSFDFTGFVEYSNFNWGSETIGPKIIKNFEHFYREINDAPASRISQIRIGYPDPALNSGNFPIPDKDGDFDKSTNPVNCYVDVLIDKPGTSTADLLVNFFGYADSHNCYSIMDDSTKSGVLKFADGSTEAVIDGVTVQSNNLNYGMYGEKLKFSTVTVEEMEHYISSEELTNEINNYFTGSSTNTDIIKLPFNADTVKVAVDNPNDSTTLVQYYGSKNMLLYPYSTKYVSIDSEYSDVDKADFNEDGTIDLDWHVTTATNIYFVHDASLYLKQGVTYTISLGDFDKISNNYNGSPVLYIYHSTYSNIRTYAFSLELTPGKKVFTFTPDVSLNGVNCYLWIKGGSHIVGKLKPQLEIGKAPTSYVVGDRNLFQSATLNQNTRPVTTFYNTNKTGFIVANCKSGTSHLPAGTVEQPIVLNYDYAINAVSTLEDSAGLAQDFVVEQNVYKDTEMSGTQLFYRKWSSGLYEVEKVIVGYPTVDISEQFRTPYPFIEKPLMIPGITDSGFYIEAQQGYDGTFSEFQVFTTTPKFYDEYAAQEFKISLKLIGRWK